MQVRSLCASTNSAGALALVFQCQTHTCAIYPDNCEASSQTRLNPSGIPSTVYILLINRVRGPYRTLWTEFFPRLMVQAGSMWAIKRGEKRGSITYGTDQANEVNKMFIIRL